MRGTCKSVKLKSLMTDNNKKDSVGLQRVHWRPVEPVKVKTVFPPIPINKNLPALGHISQPFD